MLRLVTLDVTNTLLKFSRPPGEQYAAIGQLYGLNANPKKLSEGFRISFKKHEKEFPFYGASSIGWQNWWLGVVADTFRNADCPADDDTLKRVGYDLNEHFSHGSAYELIDGSIPLLNLLKNKCVKIGALSNFDERLDSLFIQIGIKHYFDFVLTSLQFKVQKPDPKIFHKALELAGDKIKPSEAVHVGDDIHCDYLGARECGWHSILVSRTFLDLCQEEGIKPDASSMFTSLKEVLPILDVSTMPKITKT
ncbi:LOW QUALITY PROTEIN: rhythmically expressed gene 2 protein-like [Macrobrachium nipponense]|uniref:LOW QUALITY PROTEIN: rhythmically expressed gene 2 protein-like n=1 Tax=Macrobrachium nipponense TaxID=159736 RepID=UPI0030C7BA14